MSVEKLGEILRYVDDIDQKVDKILKMLSYSTVSFSKPQEAVPLPPNDMDTGDLTRPDDREKQVTDALKEFGDLVKVSQDNDIIRVETTRWMGEEWQKINDILKVLGFEWITAGKQSHWVFKG